MTNHTRNFAKLVDGVPQWGPIPLAVVTHHHDEGVDEETQEPWTRDWNTTETVLFPTAADYARAGYLPVVDDYPSEPAPDGKHYEAVGWGEFEGAIHRVYELRDNPPPAPRKWSSLAVKRVLEARGSWGEVKGLIEGANLYDDFLMADYIAEDDDAFIAARAEAVRLYGEETVAAILDSIPREA